jgi:hypothetical protein
VLSTALVLASAVVALWQGICRCRTWKPTLMYVPKLVQRQKAGEPVVACRDDNDIGPVSHGVYKWLQGTLYAIIQQSPPIEPLPSGVTGVAGPVIDPTDIHLNDVVRMRKPHPCGGFEWRVVRLGTDIGVRCITCGRKVLMPRSQFAKRVKTIIHRESEEETLRD